MEKPLLAAFTPHCGFFVQQTQGEVTFKLTRRSSPYGINHSSDIDNTRVIIGALARSKSFLQKILRVNRRPKNRMHFHFLRQSLSLFFLDRPAYRYLSRNFDSRHAARKYASASLYIFVLRARARSRGLSLIQCPWFRFVSRDRFSFKVHSLGCRKRTEEQERGKKKGRRGEGRKESAGVGEHCKPFGIVSQFNLFLLETILHSSWIT